MRELDIFCLEGGLVSPKRAQCFGEVFHQKKVRQHIGKKVSLQPVQLSHSRMTNTE
jgi:hypothetical protein